MSIAPSIGEITRKQLMAVGCSEYVFASKTAFDKQSPLARQLVCSSLTEVSLSTHPLADRRWVRYGDRTWFRLRGETQPVTR